MKTTQAWILRSNGRHTPTTARPKNGHTIDSPSGPLTVAVVTSGDPRNVAGYRILSDKQLLSRKSPTLPLTVYSL